jgi:hypothetical protein
VQSAASANMTSFAFSASGKRKVMMPSRFFIVYHLLSYDQCRRGEDRLQPENLVQGIFFYCKLCSDVVLQ